jgi:hypothetical protein
MMSQLTSQSYWPRSRSKLRLRDVFGIVVATLTFCLRLAGPLFVITWFPCLLDSASRLTLEWLVFSAAPKLPQWLLSEDFDPPTWLTAFVVTPFAAMAWAFVLSTMADRGSERGMIEVSGTRLRWARFELSPAILVTAAIFSATNLVDATLRFAERAITSLLLGDAALSDLGFDIWGLSIVAVHIVAMAVVMAWSYPVAGYVLRTGRYDLGAACRLVRGNALRFTATFVLLTLALVALDRVLDPPKMWLVHLLAPATPWTMREATIRYALDFPFSMLVIIAWAVAVGLMLDGFTREAPAVSKRRRPERPQSLRNATSST